MNNNVWFGLFYGSDKKLYAISDDLVKLHAKQKDLLTLYDVALTYNSQVRKNLQQAWSDKLDGKITNMEYITISGNLQFDRNEEYGNLEIREVRVL